MVLGTNGEEKDGRRRVGEGKDEGGRGRSRKEWRREKLRNPPSNYQANNLKKEKRSLFIDTKFLSPIAHTLCYVFDL